MAGITVGVVGLGLGRHFVAANASLAAVERLVVCDPDAARAAAIREEFPRVEITREPKSRGTKLYGPFANVRGLRGALQVLQKIFKFRTCSLDIQEEDQRWRWFRPCLLASIHQCTAPCALRISKEHYRKDIHRLQKFLEGNKRSLLEEMRQEMSIASKVLRFEEAARLRDELKELTRELAFLRQSSGVA